jgi:Domain of unknown function (DUF4389)
MASPERHPVRVLVEDDLRRSRLTVFFRVLLAVPHLVLLLLWGIAAVVLALVSWVATLAAGRSPARLHTFLARFLRYGAHVTGYVHLLANPYPSFAGADGYPFDLEVDPPEPQNRLVTGFRLLLAVPVVVLAGVLGYVAGAIAFLGWFACLALGRMPKGMRDLGAYCVRYALQTSAYVLLLTERYPTLAWEGPDSPGRWAATPQA